jgi:beta-lactamase class A
MQIRKLSLATPRPSRPARARRRLVRQALLALAATTLCLGLAGPALAGPAHPGKVADTVARLETRLGGRIGIVLREVGAPEPRIAIRADERFPMASTFKPVLCGAVLARVERGEETLGRRISYDASQIVSHSPLTKKHAGGAGLTVEALCEAAVTLSDNTATNLLMKTVGGPQGVTSFLRGLGDDTTRLDRWETKLNSAIAGDPRDTTTPRAMARTLETLLFGAGLAPASRHKVQTWMENDKVADALIRKHLPEGWRIADKTGGGANGTRNIIAVLWPERGAPHLATIYVTGNKAAFADLNAAIAEIGKAMISEIDRD